MAFEFEILDYIQTLHRPLLDKMMVFITSLGNAGIIWILLGAVLICIKKYRPCGIAVLFSLVLGLIIGNGILKSLIARDRPCWIRTDVLLLIASPKDYSFPSGHTLASFEAASALFVFKKSWGIAAAVLGGLIAFSRMYLYVHFPTDILAGILLGILFGTVSALVVRRFYTKSVLTR